MGTYKGEFTSKLTISLQEAEETRFWLEIVEGTDLASPDAVQPLIKETAEFIAILVRAIQTSKRGARS